MSLAVTAVAFLTDTVVVSGSGGMLRVHDTSVPHGAFLGETTVFAHGRIHGILPLATGDDSGGRLLVFGAKSWTVVSIRLDGSVAELYTSPVYTVADWIKAGHWLRASTHSAFTLVALALAHNQAVVCDAETGQVVREAHCTEQSILYAAALAGDTLDALVVAGGTVYGHVVVWRLATGCVERRLAGHAGAVFGVAFGASRRTLASVSDDRTLRLWRLSGECVTLYGHSARVWRCLVLRDCVVTASEDGTCLVWREEGGWHSAERWRQCAKHVWAVAANPSQTLVAGGGGDGSLLVHQLGTGHGADSRLEPVPLAVFDRVCAFALLDWDSVVVASGTSHVELQQIGEPVEPVIFSELAGFVMAASASTGGLAAIGLRNGCVALVSGLLDAPLIIPLHSGPLQRPVIASTPCCPGVYDLFTAEADGDSVTWMQVTVPQWTKRAVLALPFGSRFVTAAANGRWAAVGTARGGLVVYTVADNSSGSSLLAFLPRVHGRHALTSIVITDNGLQSCTLRTGGRDGMLNTFSVTLDNVIPVASEQLTVGRIEQLLVQGGSLAAVTFHCRRLVLVDHTSRTEVLSMPCDGATKPWQILYDGNTTMVGVVEGGKLLVYRQKAEDHPLTRHPLKICLVGGVSSMDIRDAAVATCAAGVVVATGGEDCCLRIHRFLPASRGSLELVAQARGHLSVIRCVAFIPSANADDPRYLLTAGAGGELRCWRLDTANLVEWGAVCPSGDTEAASARVMAIAILKSFPLVVFAAGYSDGSLRVWRLDTETRQFTCIASDFDHGCCVLSLAAVSLDNSRYVLLSGATDGRIRVWDIDTNSKGAGLPSLVCDRVHQSGVNTVDARRMDESRLMVVSGGDDGSVAMFTATVDGFFSASAVTRFTGIHASSVKRVTFANDATVVSVSTDQRLVAWSVKDTILSMLHMACIQA
ncbi:WD repeat-containing protein 6 [Coemansia sp. BCRC 34301]|nr:WD repeat-containing protein 6 [Coemansia sp. BCRC 34301]